MELAETAILTDDELDALLAQIAAADAETIRRLEELMISEAEAVNALLASLAKPDVCPYCGRPLGDGDD